MLLGVLTDSIWATRKDDSLSGCKFMLAEILSNNENRQKMVVVDTIGAGIGDKVIITTGSSARKMLNNENIPVDAAVIGIIDSDCKI